MTRRADREAIGAEDARKWIKGQDPLPSQSEAAFSAQKPEDEIPLEYRAAVRAYRPPKEDRR